MAWVKLDDRFHGHPKVRKAWKRSRASIGLYVMAVTYCAQHETDGVVDLDWADDMLPQRKERDAAIDALVTAGLMHRVDDERLEIHDYLEHNESRAQAEARRERDRERKARGGKGSKPQPPAGVPKDSGGNPDGVQAASGSSRAPVPSRPVPSVPPVPPKGGRKRDVEEYEEQLGALAAEWFPKTERKTACGLIRHSIAEFQTRGQEPTLDQVRTRAARWVDDDANTALDVAARGAALEFAAGAKEINDRAQAQGAAA